MYSIYIVDDNRLEITDLLSSIPWFDFGFEIMGYQTSARTALSEIVAGKPDVVISDLKMPSLDGIELMKQVKASDLEPEFILLSAYQEFEACRDFFQMNGFDYILKPLELDSAELILEKLSRRLMAKNRSADPLRFSASHSKNFDDLISFIKSNYHRKLSLKELSQTYNMNPTYICDLFAKKYGTSFVVFVTDLRMKEASNLIRETATPLKEISLYCGYPNYYHFCRVFKTYFGKAPSQYREEQSLCGRT